MVIRRKSRRTAWNRFSERAPIPRSTISSKFVPSFVVKHSSTVVRTFSSSMCEKPSAT
ncbi:unnamed protein product, partial [Nesidiocoris tenuis]